MIKNFEKQIKINKNLILKQDGIKYQNIET